MKKSTAIFFICLMFVLGGCQSGGMQESDSASIAPGGEMQSDSSSSASSVEKSAEMKTADNQDNANAPKSEESQAEEGSESTEQMIIHEAQVEAEVKSYDEGAKWILERVSAVKGYVVNQSTTQEEDDGKSGTLNIRIPESSFQSFLDQLKGSSELSVLNQSVTGQDVTEEYVDLESRLAAKEAVEKRLYQFMENAKGTEDLLTVSNDLERVQEEIESMKGRMNYLKTRSDMSNISLSLKEDALPGVTTTKLNTWERTQQEFMSSVNGLLSFGSTLIIFLAGRSPIFLLIAAIAGAAYYLFKKRFRKESPKV
ncbi:MULTISPECIES: DUF4349 domain-containing protein [Bacillus]|uniref:DUF4349 domain-containing protein n=2 Tax=Bacillus TaxID=1386 RepID=A0A0M3RA07_9BACI|nr:MULTISPECIES: DUF4349 domain-containing protein [Bacillus]ALC82346.1 hypothetical protein AM592_12695 [Bacillus gobiensis]MBP1081213.1 phosphopantetheinyl transferase (holo-ACP synthase) [Bacillus capparidis]MED1095893.1 DUF4349 domain-containing protein [Bacillus capparidis]